MFTFDLKSDASRPLRILCLGAHSDDIEIGCGASINRLVRERPDVQFTWIVFSAMASRLQEAQASFAEYFEPGGSHELQTKDFRNGFFPAEWSRIKEYFETLKARPRPDIIFTHFGGDLHQDHKVISDLTWNTFRDDLILEYEIPKYDGGLGSPSVFIQSEKTDIDAKVQRLDRCFGSQADKQWFTEDTFRGLARLRGIECNARSGFAEAFYCRKLRLLG